MRPRPRMADVVCSCFPPPKDEQRSCQSHPQRFEREAPLLCKPPPYFVTLCSSIRRLYVIKSHWLPKMLAAATVLAIALFAGHIDVGAQGPTVDPALLNAYRWRSIGPSRGGRSI